MAMPPRAIALHEFVNDRDLREVPGPVWSAQRQARQRPALQGKTAPQTLAVLAAVPAEAEAHRLHARAAASLAARAA